jgi:hypothetical protein
MEMYSVDDALATNDSPVGAKGTGSNANTVVTAVNSATTVDHARGKDHKSAIKGQIDVRDDV